MSGIGIDTAGRSVETCTAEMLAKLALTDDHKA